MFFFTFKNPLVIHPVPLDGGVVVPHVIPYQGSKRKQAPTIAAHMPPVRTFYEPFAGSAAMTIYAAHHNLAKNFVISDKLEPLVQLHKEIIETPKKIADRYEEIWTAQPKESEKARLYFNNIRDEYSGRRDSALLLFLIIRCVANAVRFNKDGGFNQSPDKRRLGTKPDRLRESIFKVSKLLKGRTEFRVGDFSATTADAEPKDLVYMDPPYQGTSESADKRYFESLDRERLIIRLREMTARGVPFILSYDGQHGEKKYGEDLPEDLHAKKLLVRTGRSTQGTLNGRDVTTYESIYLSKTLGQPKKVPQLDLAL
jgi:DNA adenine methylase